MTGFIRWVWINLNGDWIPAAEIEGVATGPQGLHRVVSYRAVDKFNVIMPSDIQDVREIQVPA